MNSALYYKMYVNSISKEIFMRKHNLSRNIIALLVAVLIVVPVLAVTAAAEADTPAKGTDYSTVFIHGLFGWGEEDDLNKILPYWGLSSGDFYGYMKNKGYDVYAASVGPLSSAHDRCCELFASLTGTKVDYGQAHADKMTAEFAASGSALTHGRYGRDYTGNAKINSWGPIFDENGKVEGWYDSKINLVGHSFGGPTAVEFVNLLANGDADEIAWGKEQAEEFGGDWHDYISPLFWGDYDGEYLVNSITSIAGVLNGTTFITANDDLMGLARPLVTLAASLTGDTVINKLYDFQLEQFGITCVPGDTIEEKVALLTSLGFADGTDNAFYDLTTEGTNALKTGWATFDNIYYFSYSCDKSYKAGGADMPDPDMMIALIPFSMIMGSYHSASELVYNVDGSLYSAIDDAWQMNDGMVNTISSRYPFGTPHKEYNVNSIESGVWNVHPDIDEDHFGVIGGFFSPKPVKTKALYDTIMSDIEKTVPVFDENRVNVGTQENKLKTPEITSAHRTLLKNVALGWKSVGLCRYDIYRASEKDGDYVRIDTTLLTSYTDFSAKSGKTYYYKIVAVPLYKNASSSEFSSPVGVK